MYEKFEKLSQVKKRRIINAGMQVFGSCDYRNATCDEIVKIAGISKGSLFQYFGNKQGFCLYLWKYFVNVILQYIQPVFDGDDLIKLVEESMVLKMKVLIEYPYSYDFALRCYADSVIINLLGLQNYNEQIMSDSIERVVQAANVKYFKAGVDPKSLIEIIVFMAEGFMKRKMESKTLDFDTISDEFKLYLNVLREQFYKEEFV